MKRNIGIGLIVLLIAACAVFELLFVTKSLQHIETNATELESLLKTGENVERQKYLAEKLQKDWEKKENFLCVFIYHQEIKEIGDSISMLSAQIEGDNFSDAKEEVHQLVYLLGTFKDLYEFNVFNIL